MIVLLFCAELFGVVDKTFRSCTSSFETHFFGYRRSSKISNPNRSLRLQMHRSISRTIFAALATLYRHAGRRINHRGQVAH